MWDMGKVGGDIWEKWVGGRKISAFAFATLWWLPLMRSTPLLPSALREASIAQRAVLRILEISSPWEWVGGG